MTGVPSEKLFLVHCLQSTAITVASESQEGFKGTPQMDREQPVQLSALPCFRRNASFKLPLQVHPNISV